VLGIRTNIPFLLRLIDLPDFVEGRLHTGFVDEHMPSLTGCTGPDGYVYAAAALAAGAGGGAAAAATSGPPSPPDPWSQPTGWGR
jgi:3-methylcrotonyl-CoA carboxylase alpha subunit